MRYTAIIFDLGDTLLKYSPTHAQRYILRCRTMGIDVSVGENVLERALVLAANSQLLKEQDGAECMSDAEFADMCDRAALRCVLPTVPKTRLPRGWLNCAASQNLNQH